MFPLLWMVISSFKTQADNMSVPPVIIFQPTVQNYINVISDNPFLQYTFNSFYVAIFATGLALVFGLPVAYYIARFKCKKLAIAILLSRMMPGISYLVPWFILFSRLRLVGTYTGLIFTHLTVTLPLVIWIMIGFFEDIPKSYEEAAFLDGASDLTCFFRIMLPLVKPGLVSSGILTFIQSWNTFMYSVVMANHNTQTLPVAVFNFLSYGGIDWGGLTAAATLITLPVLVLALLIQRHLVSGLTFGGIKG
ncbi:MAG: carbohydrate ABC transporter permease [Peptococcaceae bacterium]|nr:carbohydrate ABC transporter permease [Peptococcaceae bacterium]